MTKAGKIFLWVACGAVILLVVLTAAAVIVSRVLDTDAMGRKLATELETRYHLHSERIRISFLPFPRIALRGVRMTVPETLTASAEAVLIHPSIWPLFTGRIVPAEIELLGPVVTARLPEQSFENSAKSAFQKLMRLKDMVALLQPMLLAIIPGMTIDARNGGVELYCGQNPAFFFNEIDLRSSVHAKRVEFELTSGKSNLWEALSFNGWIDLGGLKGWAELNSTGGNPGDLLRYLNICAPGKSDSQVDLTLALSAGGPGSLHADFKASAPNLALGCCETGGGEGETQRVGDRFVPSSPHPRVPVSISKKGDGREDLVATNGTVTGSLNIDAKGIDIFIPHFQFDYPRLNLTGRYTERFSDRSATLDIDGMETDVAAVRNAIETVDRKNPIARRVFEIVRAGEVPSIHFSAHSNTPSDLGKFENFILKGSIEKGSVFAPKAGLLVSNVSGNVVIESGILTATRLSGRTAGSSTSGGEMRIGLPKDNPLFHLDLPITADLSELPEVLERVVTDQAFRQELAKIKDVAGKAQGRLLLGESLKALTVRVESGPFKLFGRYGGIAEALDLKGASFLMEGTKVSVASLAAKVGSSSFEQVDLSFGWGETHVLKIDSHARSIVSMDLVGPYLTAHEYWKNFLDSRPKGLLAIDSFRFIGPPSDTSKWVLHARGSLEDIVFHNRGLKGPLTLKKGDFEINGDQIVFRQVDALLADSSLAISGAITGYLDRARKVQLQLSGRLGPQGNEIVASLAGFPHWLRGVSNLDLVSSRLTWDREQTTTFEGQMELSTGPHITVNLVKTPQELSIGELVIKDEDSDATISMKSAHNRLEVGFSGKLSNKTADRLLVDNRLLTGPVAGKFSANLYLDAPEESSVQGEMTISGFQVPVKNLAAAARIENAEIEADGKTLNVKSAMISWNGSRLSLAGSVAFTGGAYLVDMNGFADSFDLESVLPKTEGGEPRTEEGGKRTEEGGGKTEDGERRIESGTQGASTGEDEWRKGGKARPRREEVVTLSSAPRGSENDHVQAGVHSLEKALDVPLKGVIRVRCERLYYGKLSWEPANADVVFNPNSIDVQLDQANLCGISTTGSIRVAPGGFNISVDLSAKDKDLDSEVTCIVNKKHVISGRYTLTGNLSAKVAASGSLVNSLQGDLAFKAKDGRIFRFGIFTKIISVLSVSEIYRGVVPDLGKGCAFKSIEAKGKIRNGKLTLSDSVLDGPCVKMVFHGEIDLGRQKVDAIALVAPQRTVERMVDATPIMGKVLDGAFLALPVGINGDLADPAVVPLSPTAVGEEIYGVMKRVLKLPLAVFQPQGEKK